MIEGATQEGQILPDLLRTPVEEQDLRLHQDTGGCCFVEPVVCFHIPIALLVDDPVPEHAVPEGTVRSAKG